MGEASATVVVAGTNPRAYMMATLMKLLLPAGAEKRHRVQLKGIEPESARRE
ncbi:hypothetical protein [Rhizobium anhuiense]|uniref:hypothetical protein n=1 Tax=Rhizobium anhuiense TaxID=1184720 RepID=UPI0015CF657C|nr:hypothetical protein [Rhizobium anhuiense]